MIVTSFYKYVEIENPKLLRNRHMNFCNKLGVKGKILMTKEGINGCASGTEEQINKYENHLKKNPLFKDLHFKRTNADTHPYRKIMIKVRDEIVTSKFNVSLKNKAEYISPENLNKLIEKGNVILVDARNNYESKIGKFKNAITPNIKTFRQFKNIIKDLEPHKNKTIVTYCTGGIRCEKASAVLKENGFTNVFQLEGGILNYIHQFPNKFFEGRCFVFDNRLSIPSGTKTKDISICEHCHAPSGRYINCKNQTCDKLFICCEECDKNFNGTCSKACINHFSKSSSSNTLPS